MSEATTLLEYVPEQILEIERLQAVEAAAVADVARIDKARREAEIAHYKRADECRKPDRSRVLAEAALRGEKPPPEPEDPPGAPVEDYAATVKGLEAMREEAGRAVNEARAAIRAAGINLFRSAAERAAADYLLHARALEASHAAIGAAQTALDNVGAGRGTDLLVGSNWSELKIPGSDQLGALKGANVTPYGFPTIAGGDREACHKAIRLAHEKVRAGLSQRLGRFPLDRWV
jgi:hypothetical protein